MQLPQEAILEFQTIMNNHGIVIDQEQAREQALSILDLFVLLEKQTSRP